jgi:hypothetical protein
MAKKSTKKVSRHTTATEQVRAFLVREPELRDALKLFDLSMKQYAQALSHLNRPQIVTTASSTPV